MTNYCAFSKDHLCPKWADYELTRYELEEHLREYINRLQAVLNENGIEIPSEY